MTKKDEIRKILNSPPANLMRWNFSNAWIKSIEDKCKKPISKNEVRSIHSRLCDELINRLTSNFKSSSWSKSLLDGEIEDTVMEAISKLESNYDSKKAKEYTFLSTAITNSLRTKAKNIKPIIKKEESNYVQPETEKENTISKRSFMNDILDLDGKVHLDKFLKNISISEGIKITNRQSILHFKLTRNSVDTVAFYDDLGNKYNPGKYSFVPNFFKYQTICETPHRIEMFKARDLVEESKSNFHRTVIQPLKNQGDYKSALDEEEKTPVLSAVALDKYGDVIKTAYKGQCGEMKHHCEFTLFESVFDSEDWKRIKGGTVYVTLEPCHKRGIDSDTGKPKIPCAVRCLESGIATIYVAHHDPDESVKGHGIKTLETGQYTFKKDNGILSVNGFRDLDSVMALQKYFEDKGYKKVVDNDESLVYQVGKPVKVNLFHTDIALQIMKINKSFLKDKFPEAYISTSLV